MGMFLAKADRSGATAKPTNYGTYVKASSLFEASISTLGNVVIVDDDTSRLGRNRALVEFL